MSTNSARNRASRTLRDEMRRFVESGQQLPGLVYLVEHNGETFVEALGEMHLGGAPMQRETIFRIASLSKPIAGVATLMLIEDGLISLDQPVDEFLPELAAMSVLRSIGSNLDDTVTAQRSITVKDLLTFRSGTGIVVAPPGTYPIQRATEERELEIGPPNPAIPPEPNEWIRRFAELPLMHQPGESWMYAASSEILGVLLARVSGQSSPDLLASRVFEPLGMVDTGFFVPPDKASRFATCYIPDSHGDQLEIFDPPVNGQWNAEPSFPSGGGGLVSTIDDYARFARLMLNNGLHEGQRQISEELISAMITNQLTGEQRTAGELILGTGNGWGYCVGVRVEPSDQPGHVGSYGWNGGLGTTWLNDPASDLVALLFTQVHWTSAELPESASAFLTDSYLVSDSSEN